MVRCQMKETCCHRVAWPSFIIFILCVFFTFLYVAMTCNDILHHSRCIREMRTDSGTDRRWSETMWERDSGLSGLSREQKRASKPRLNVMSNSTVIICYWIVLGSLYIFIISSSIVSLLVFLLLLLMLSLLLLLYTHVFYLWMGCWRHDMQMLTHKASAS
jgi:hypothetical protein